MKEAVSKRVILGDLMLSVTTNGAVSERDFNGLIEDLKNYQITRYLGGSLGKVEMTSVQRKLAAEIMKANGVRTAVLTDDSLVRGLVTAAGWLGANIKAFPWKDVRAALGYLGVFGRDADQAEQEMLLLRSECEAAIQ